MTTQLLFYNQAVPVNPARHKGTYIKSGGDYAFAAKVSSVPLTAAEFPLAAAEYPIVFAGSGESVFPVVVLGGEKEQNLFVREDGSWGGRYVPAFVRRYPFVFAQGPDAQTLTLCIDEGFAGCNTEGRGERLFDADGERTSFLEQVLNFLRAYQVQHQRTQAFCNRLKELGLLQPVQATLARASGERRVLGGMQVVNRARLKELEPEKIAEMLRSDELEAIYLHLHSLANLRVIGERLPTPAEDTAPPAEPSKAEPSEAESPVDDADGVTKH